MSLLAAVLDEALDLLSGRGFDPRLVAGRALDTGPIAQRVRGLAARLNAQRTGKPKEPVVLWSFDQAALTRRGPWVYVARSLVQQLSDDALAFVLAHEMGHHDLGHLRPPLVAASRLLGHSQRMELMADAYALALVERAGFDPQGALEALSPELWGTDPADEVPEGWFAGWVHRHRYSHPPTPLRLQAIERALRDR